MSNYQVGQRIKKRCTSCYHNETKIIKVTVKELEEKVANILWVQCPECGMNDIELVPEHLHA